MTICPHTRKQCVCQPSEGIPCEYVPMVPVDDPLNDALEYLRDEANDGHDVSLTNAQARLIWAYAERLNGRCAALAALQYGQRDLDPESKAVLYGNMRELARAVNEPSACIHCGEDHE